MAKRYVRILHEVEALQANECNLNEIRDFAGDVKKVETNSASQPSYYTIPGVGVVLWVGDWLIKHPNGRLEVKSNQLFHQEYEPK